MGHDLLPVELANKGFDLVGTAYEKLHLVLVYLYHPGQGGIAIVLMSIVEALEHPNRCPDDLDQLTLDPSYFAELFIASVLNSKQIADFCHIFYLQEKGNNFVDDVIGPDLRVVFVDSMMLVDRLVLAEIILHLRRSYALVLPLLSTEVSHHSKIKTQLSHHILSYLFLSNFFFELRVKVRKIVNFNCCWFFKAVNVGNLSFEDPSSVLTETCFNFDKYLFNASFFSFLNPVKMRITCQFTLDTHQGLSHEFGHCTLEQTVITQSDRIILFLYWDALLDEGAKFTVLSLVIAVCLCDCSAIEALIPFSFHWYLIESNEQFSSLSLWQSQVICLFMLNELIECLYLRQQLFLSPFEDIGKQ